MSCTFVLTFSTALNTVLSRHRERSQGRHFAKLAAICLSWLLPLRDCRSRYRSFAMTELRLPRSRYYARNDAIVVRA